MTPRNEKGTWSAKMEGGEGAGGEQETKLEKAVEGERWKTDLSSWRGGVNAEQDGKRPSDRASSRHKNDRHHQDACLKCTKIRPTGNRGGREARLVCR